MSNPAELISTENGHNPMWNESCEFIVKNSHFAMLRFEVQDEDMFGEKNFIGQTVYPVSGERMQRRTSHDSSLCLCPVFS